MCLFCVKKKLYKKNGYKNKKTNIFFLQKTLLTHIMLPVTLIGDYTVGPAHSGQPAYRTVSSNVTAFKSSLRARLV